MLHAVAYRLMHALRTAAALVAPALGRLLMDTLRLRLLEVAAQVTSSVRRILVRLPRTFPLARRVQRDHAPALRHVASAVFDNLVSCSPDPGTERSVSKRRQRSLPTRPMVCCVIS